MSLLAALQMLCLVLWMCYSEKAMGWAAAMDIPSTQDVETMPQSRSLGGGGGGGSSSGPASGGKTVKKAKLQMLKVPDIMLIGAMKCGTTSLHKLMIDHPKKAICGYGEKEKHFFNSGEYEKNYAKHVQHYYSEYSGCQKNTQLTIDSTPGYAVNLEVVDRVKESYEKVDLAKKKFILILREPVARHYSEFQMALRICLDINNDLSKKKNHDWRLSRHEAACSTVAYNYSPDKNNPVPSRYMTFQAWVTSPFGRRELRRGHYKETINRWLKIIRRDQLFIINFQSLIYNTTDVMNRLTGFLGLNVTWGKVKLPGGDGVKPNTYLDCTTVDRLMKHFNKANGDLVKFISSGDKPPQEPPFGEFENTRAKCVKPFNLSYTTDDLAFNEVENENNDDGGETDDERSQGMEGSESENATVSVSNMTGQGKTDRNLVDLGFV